MNPDDTQRCPPPDEALALASTIPAPPSLPDRDEEGFTLEYRVRPVTFLPSPLFDLSDPELDEP